MLTVNVYKDGAMRRETLPVRSATRFAFFFYKLVSDCNYVNPFYVNDLEEMVTNFFLLELVQFCSNLSRVIQHLLHFTILVAQSTSGILHLYEHI